MNDTKIIKYAATLFIGMVVAPIVIGTATYIIGGTTVIISNSIKKNKLNKRIKKGLRDGNITEIDGKYYDVIIEEA